jgi:hypothetical protein
MADRVAMTAAGLRHRVIGARVSLMAIQQQQEPRSRMRPGRRAARSDEGGACCTLIIG